MRSLFLIIWSVTILIACSKSIDKNPALDDTPQPQSNSSPNQNNENPLLGLPPVPVPQNNLQTPEKIALGDKLFHDKRFSIDGTVSCANCHVRNKAFTDGLQFSLGHHNLTGTRNAPTVINAAFNKSQFWDGREPDLEAQSKQPFINPVEHGLANHEPIISIVRNDPTYKSAFNSVFGINENQITIDHVAKAIASFERTIVSGNSAFDRFYFIGDNKALTEQQKRGFQLFIGQGRCVSCHTIEQDHAIFTDSRFHNIGIGINEIQQDIPKLAKAYLKAKYTGSEVDVQVLTNKKSSELGRFAVTKNIGEMGAFKTPTLRNVELTAPYMHDGSLKTLKDVIIHYNNGGVTPIGAKVNPYLSGGIRPLNLTDSQIDDLIAFMKALTSPEYATSAVNAMPQ